MYAPSHAQLSRQASCPQASCLQTWGWGWGVQILREIQKSKAGGQLGRGAGRELRRPDLWSPRPHLAPVLLSSLKGEPHRRPSSWWGPCCPCPPGRPGWPPPSAVSRPLLRHGCPLPANAPAQLALPRHLLHISCTLPEVCMCALWGGCSGASARAGETWPGYLLPLCGSLSPSTCLSPGSPLICWGASYPPQAHLC